jgi:hypothetical protein
MRWANSFTQVVTLFGDDPTSGGRQGRGILADIWQRVQGARTHPYGPEKADPSTTWNGVLLGDSQQFRGADFLLGGGVAYKDGGAADISSGLVEGPMGDPARRIFAQRLARRAPGGMG